MRGLVGLLCVAALAFAAFLARDVCEVPEGSRTAAPSDTVPSRELGDAVLEFADAPTGSKPESVTTSQREAPTPAARRVLRGRLLDMQQEPLAGCPLGIFTPEERVELVTDAEGRYETPPLPVGRFSWSHPTHGEGDHRARWIGVGDVLDEDHTYSNDFPAGDGPYERDLVLRGPPTRIVEVLVLENGAPAVDVAVELRAATRLSERDEEAWWLDALHAREVGGEWFWSASATTGEGGLASLAVWATRGFVGGVLQACRFEEHARPEETSEDGSPVRVFRDSRIASASALLELTAPLTGGVRTLHLDPSGSVVVRVRGPDGSEPTNLSLRLRSNERFARSHWGMAGRRSFFDFEDGTYRSNRVGHGSYNLAVENPWHDDFQDVPVEVLPGRTTEVELTLSEGERRLAFEAVILDAKGALLEDPDVWLEYSQDGVTWDRAEQTDDGRLGAWGRPSETVTIRQVFWIEDVDLFPEEVVVPFGTRNLSFEVVSDPPEIELELHAVSALDGSPVRASWVLDRGARHFAEDREVESFRWNSKPRVRAHEDLRWRAVAVGFREAEGMVLDQVDVDAAGPQRLEVRLEPGFGLTFAAVDEWQSLPLPGAILRSEAGFEVLADENGIVRLAGPGWTSWSMHHPTWGSCELDTEELLDAWERDFAWLEGGLVPGPGDH